MRSVSLAWFVCVALTAPAARIDAPAQERIPQSIIDGVVTAVCQKQIVLLGELPSHGESLGFEAKAKIIDGLVAKCGFTAVFFEAGVYDFIGLERAARSGVATQDQLDNAIGRFWWTRELAPWRRSLFDGLSGQRLTAAGLDDQVSITSRYAQATLPTLMATAECSEIVTRNLTYAYDAKTPFDDAEHRRLKQCATNAVEAAAVKRPGDAAGRLMLENFARFADRQRSSPAMSRDESMFRNLDWHLERLPANTRAVVWTATVHAARQRGSLTELPLGARAVERWGDRVASVGFTAYGGQTSRAARPAAPIGDAPPESLEAVMTAGSAWALLDSDKLRSSGAMPSRLFGRLMSDTWSHYFDAVVVIRNEVAPTFDPWK